MIELNDSSHFHLYFHEFNEILNLLKSNIDKEFTLKEIKDRITLLKTWSEESLISNLYLLEKTSILKVLIVQEAPIFKYQFELDIKKVEMFLSMIEGCFKLDLEEHTISEILNEVEIWAKNEYWNFLIKHWETNILASCTISERKDKLIIERDKQKESYFSDSNVLKFYCVHDLDKLSKDLTDFRYISKLPIHPDDFLGIFSEPLDLLKDALKGRFKQWFQIQTLNYLIEKENKLTYIFNDKKVSDIKIAPKYYALMMWVLIDKLGKVQKFERDLSDNLSRKAIEKYCETTFPNISPQMFYREYSNIVNNKFWSMEMNYPKYQDNIKSICPQHLEVIKVLIELNN